MRKAAVLVALLALASVTFAAPAPEKGDKILRFIYTYGSAEDVPGTGGIEFLPSCHGIPRIEINEPDQTKRSSFGAGFSYFLTEDLASTFSATVPYGDPGTDTLSLSAGLDYFFGQAFVPVSLGYRGDLDSFLLAVGFGYDLPAGERLVWRFAATEQFLTSDHVADELAWNLSAALGIRLGQQ